MNKAYEKKLLLGLAKASKDQKLLKAFLEDILTEKEYAEVVRRIEILVRLQKGEPQRSIAHDLGLGIATVTRGSHVLLKKGQVFRKIIGN